MSNRIPVSNAEGRRRAVYEQQRMHRREGTLRERYDIYETFASKVPGLYVKTFEEWLED
jgi:hypothetical protein